MHGFFNIEAKSIFGETIKMDKYRGKKILIVNVASKCGLTPQYSELQELYKNYSDNLDFAKAGTLLKDLLNK